MSFVKGLAPVAALLIVCASSAHAGHGTGGDPYVFTNWDGDHFWSNPGNWNQPEPPGPGHVAWINFTTDEALINHNAGSVGELVVGQGGGSGAVKMTTGGSINGSHLNMAWGGGRDGSWTQDGGDTTVLEVRAGRDAGGGTATIDISDGTFQSTLIYLGQQNVASHMTVSGGTVSTTSPTGIRLSDFDASSSATSSLTITGGTVNTHLIAIGARSGGPGSGALTIGGDATVNLAQNMFMRANNGSVTINGSEATITGNRDSATGFEVHTGTDTNFNFDSSGISTINLNGHANGSRLQFSNLPGEATGVLNVDATGFMGQGEFYLIRFSDTIAGGVLGAGEFSAHNLTFAPGYSGFVTYVRDQGVAGNGLVLTVIPEPSSLCLLAVAGIALVFRRRRG